MPIVHQPPDFTSNPDLLKRLIYSKYLFNRAQSLQRQGDELASAEAVLTAHDSVEMLMGVVTDFLRINAKWEFMAFWEIIENKTGKEPQYKHAIKRLNNLRTGFKHAANLPNPSVVADLMPSVAAFCADVTAQYLRHNYETVTLTDLIQNAAARERVKQAEKAKAAGNIQQALLDLRVAFDTLHKEAREKHKSILIQGIGFGTSLTPRLQEAFGPFVKTFKLDKLTLAVHQLVETMNGMLLGIDPSRFRRFSQTAPISSRGLDKSVFYLWQTKPQDLGPEDVDFCQEFVIDFALRLTNK